MAEPGEMHEIDKAFYDLTVAQRNQAWAEIERLKAAARDVCNLGITLPAFLHDEEFGAALRRLHLLVGGET